MAETICESVRLSIVEVRPASGEESTALIRCEHVQFQRCGAAAPAAVAGGNEHLTRSTGHVLTNDGGVLRIIEDQQPIGMRATEPECVQDGVHGDLGILALLDFQSARKRKKRSSDKAFFVGGNPPNQLIVRLIPAGVLSCELALADPAEPMQRRWQDSCLMVLG